MKPTISLLVFVLPILISSQLYAQKTEYYTSNFHNQDYEIFGTDKKIPFALTGYIYKLPPDYIKLPPKFNPNHSLGKIHVQMLDIPARKFDQGFPGLPNLKEWFAIDYHGFFYIEKDMEYEFAIQSDDGSKLYIDEKLIIDNDGQHAPNTEYGKIFLTKGLHRMNLQYFQGPRFYIALKLMYRNAEDNLFRTFKYSDFMPLEIFNELNTTTDTSDIINIEIKEFLLFEFNSYALKENAKLVLDEIYYSFIENNNSVGIIVKGHTDDIGTAEYNQKLSEQRAKSVYDYFTRSHALSNRIWTLGYGESDPKVLNSNEENRAQNRRVEIMILPLNDAKRFYESSQTK